MATSILPLFLFSLLAVTASARPCKTLFYFATTTSYHPYSRSQNPNPNDGNFLFQKPSSLSSPRYLTLIFTTTTTTSRFPHHHRPVNYNDRPGDLEHDMIPYKGPVKLYSSVSSSIRDRTKDIMSVVGALLFGVGCGVLTAATMYFVWSLFSPHRFDFDDDSSFSSDDDDDITSAKKMGYLAIPTKTKVVDDDLKKPASPAKEAV
ncbi:Hypothetical predicted protein [Olea europaea subsp. europaea]|uniref:Transmembrane protein n=1 Tax=Olea europaea subsp. europaea TaxID=158383 RepID=A0A8S0RMY2_OLEEU|nr:Hypothetical predicted protein [Olea europaea subsp. europaea]